MEENKKSDPRRYALNVTLVGAASLAGFATVAILFLALFAGLWLDNFFSTENHIYTIVLLCVSVPFTLMAMLWVVRFTTSRIQLSGSPKDEEDAASG
ncbi:MAG: AtpZ/AtpI family protein [Anaerolineales bacterium]|nr:AtpZ/AtpI family protein [Anaerolineales bacterium]